MYVPSHFAESDPATLHDFVERHSFGLLVSQLGGELAHGWKLGRLRFGIRPERERGGPESW